MVEKKKNTATKNKITKKTESKKATVGAWWKSAVVEETPNVTSPAKSSPEKTPKKQTGRKTEARVSAKSATKSGKKSTPRGAKMTSPVDESRSSEKPGEAATVEKETKKPARKRSPRKKKPASSMVESPVADGASQNIAESEKTKPARKRPARKKKPSVSAEEKTSSAEVTGTIEQPVAEGAQPVAKKKAGKRPARKTAATKKEKDPAPVDSPKVEGEESPGAEELTPKPARKRPQRKRRPRKMRPKVSELQAEEVAEVIAAESESATQLTDKDTESKHPDSQETEESINDSGDVSQESQAEPVVEQATKEEQKEKKQEKQAPKPVIKLLINAEEPEECRLALLEDGRLESIHVATVSRAHTKSNIYKGKIVAIEANLQAAFVEYGTDKNGFLPFSEIHPEYYKEDVNEKTQKLIDQQQWKRLSIKDVVERGQDVLVQVVKEEVGNKGANMTTYLSLPGRCVVLMPGSDSTGISRKISGEERRSQLRDYVKSIDIPEGIGWIVRTASIDITKTALSRDVGYLLRLWSEVKKKGQEINGVGLIYQDHNHVLRFLREHFDPDIQEILVDDEESLGQVKEFVELLPSKQRNVRVKLHRGARPIFNQYSIEDQIESIYQPRVNLPSGGSIVIDPTEALVAIDVNSGSTSKGQNFEASIFQANMEAAKELARQLRLRDLGGLVVVDFIDMRSTKNIREVERQVKTAMRRDKAKVDISRISKFGLMQISRQKLGAPIEAGNYRVCTHCKGRGMVRSVETLALYYLRRIHTGATRKVVNQIECHFPLDVAQYLLNYKRNELKELETKYNAEVIIIAEPSFKPADNDIIFHKAEKDDPAKKRS